MTIYMVATPTGALWSNVLLGVSLGLSLGFTLIGLDMLLKRCNIRSFNIAIMGIFIGYLMGQALVCVFDAILAMSTSIFLQSQTIEILKISLFLFGIYMGSLLTLKAADEIHVSIPFVKFTPIAQRKKDLLIDLTVLSDARIIDFAATGILDHQLIIPRFLVKEIYAQSETGDEMTKSRAKRCLEVAKKLEAVPNLEVRYNETDFPEIKEMSSKLIRLARLLDANMLTADTSRIQMSTIEGIRIINLHTLSTALKPLMQTGEQIKIKIQRYGKEPRQGVGYLDDGTMVVVNGGGQFLGEVIDAHVLSVKHTSSGRMIFCNACDDDALSHEFDEETADEER